jgi:hypothetical protein
VNSPIINILTYKLPFELSNLIYSEYEARVREFDYLIEKNSWYRRELGSVHATVKAILALSLFYKRVIANLDGAVGFQRRVRELTQVDTIRIGSYDLTRAEGTALVAVVLSFNDLLQRFNLTTSLFAYHETRQLLRAIIELKKMERNDKDNSSSSESQR